MADLARQLGGKVWQIDIEAGQKVSAISIANLTKGHSRIRLNIGAAADVTLIEHYSGEPGAFSNLDLTIKMGKGAKLSRIIIHDDPADHVRVTTTHFSVWAEAQISQHTLSFGAALSRLETRVAAMGQAVSATESSLFYMRQRGIPLGQARAMLTEAFLGEVFDDLEDEELRESLLGKLRVWLEAQS